MVAVAAVIGASAGSSAGAQPTATTSAATRPPIHKMLIPYPKKRKREMAAYSKRHYGQYKWRLNNPKTIVIHYAVAGSISTIFNTFEPTSPTSSSTSCPTSARTSQSPPRALSTSSSRRRSAAGTRVGLNWTAIGVEHVGFSDQDILNRPAQLNGSLQFVQWLRCQYGIPVNQVIGHNESLSSPFYKELDPRFQGPDARRLESRGHADLPRGPDQARRLLSLVATMAE